MVKSVIATAIIQFVITTAISYIISPKPKAPKQSSQDEAKGTLVNKDSNNNPIPIVYGQRQVGLTRVFVESSGTDNQYLYVAGVLCEGRGAGISSIDEIYVDDKLVTFDGALSDGTSREVSSSDANFYKGGESLISIQGFYGLDAQSASSLLDTTTNWTSDHKLSGLAYVALRFKWNQDAFNGLPEVRVTVSGKKIYDPRLDSTKGGSGSHREDDVTTWEYSNNSSLVLLDYLRNGNYGKGIPNSAFETEYDSFKTSADTCDTQVTPYVGSATDTNLFETNAVLDTEKKVIDNVRELLVPMRAIFNYTQGKYKIIIEGSGSSQLLLTKDNVVSEVKIQGETKSDKFNRVIGTFTNPDKDYQSDTVSFPPIDDSGLDVEDQHATMLSNDNSTLLEKSFDMLQVTSPYQAEEICENILKRSRNNLKAEVTVTSEALNLSIGDIVTATYDTAGFSNKPFRVMSLAINADSTVTLGLEEHQDNFYTWGSKAQAPTISDTVLPNPFNVSPPSSVTLDDQLIAYNDGTVIVALDIAIGASPDSFVDYYQVEYKKASETDYQIHGQGTGLNQRVLNVIDQETYNVRVKAVNSLGVSSTYVTTTRTIIGAIAPPSDVEDFSCNIVGNTAHLSWSPVSDLDLAFYAINYSTELSGATWNNSFPLVAKVSRPATSVSVPARVGSFLIKAVDKLGNYSSNETIVTTNISAIGNFNAVATQTENPDFTGVKSNIVLIEEGLTLDTVEQFDDNTTDNFDDITTRLFDSGTQGSNLFSTGTYAFSSVVDIGAIQTSRVTASITQTATDTDRIFDFVSGNFDDESSNFDGDASVQSDSHLEIAVSDDNVTYTSFKNFNVGDYRGRYYKFRLFMTSKNNSASGIVSALSVTVDMEDRIFSGNNIVSGTGTKTVTFILPFYNSNYALGITAESLATGDYFEISNRSVNGFDVAFKNSGATGISKTFDYMAKGY